MRFTGLATGRLFAWATLLKDGAFPTLSGPCQGKLVPTDISKWRALIGEQGVRTVPATTPDREITVSHFVLRSYQEKLNVLVAFERESETLVLYSAVSSLSANQVVGVIAELNRRATEKLGQAAHEVRDCRIWMPKSAPYLDASRTLCASRPLPVEEGAKAPPPPTREPKRVSWGTGRVQFYPLDWQVQWLEQTSLQDSYDLPDGRSLAALRKEILRIAARVNSRSRARKQRPTIEMLTRVRHVSQRHEAWASADFILV